MVSAASRRWAKIPPISSGIVPITKQLKSVTERSVPAPARIGRPAEIEILQHGVKAFCPEFCPLLGLGQGVGDPAPTFLDGLVHACPSWPFRRYFMSQICWEIAATCGISLQYLPEASIDRKRGLAPLTVR
jgi:hypothetical protein